MQPQPLFSDMYSFPLWIFNLLHLCEAYKNIWLAWAQFWTVFPVPLRGLWACLHCVCHGDSPKKSPTPKTCFRFSAHTAINSRHFFFTISTAFVNVFSYRPSPGCIIFNEACIMASENWCITLDRCRQCISRSGNLIWGQLKYLAVMQPLLYSDIDQTVTTEPDSECFICSKIAQYIDGVILSLKEKCQTDASRQALSLLQS